MSGVDCNRSLQTASCPRLADTIHPTIPTPNQYIVRTHTLECKVKNKRLTYKPGGKTPARRILSCSESRDLTIPVVYK